MPSTRAESTIRAAPVRTGARPARPKQPPRSSGIEEIYQRILDAIVERRLPPGTQLVEERLASIFAVSRTKIRQALARLAHDSIVTLVPNRGAFVSSPTVDEARQVFEARRLIEPNLVRSLVRSATAAQIARLRQHVALESSARAAGDKRSIIRLSGVYHRLIAEMAGNTFLTRAMRELETLTTLVITLYDAPSVPSCPHHEHSDITDAIEAHAESRAAALMLKHLNHVEASLDLNQVMAGDIDLEAVFS